jgi:hypothetical protein
MKPLEQLEKFGEVIHQKTFKCSKCKEISSAKMNDGTHLCLKHWDEKETK